MTTSERLPPSSEDLALSATELLETAEHLFSSGDGRALRAAVLEAVSALESHVHRNIFSRLSQKLGKEMASWLDTRTRTDFDARLSLLYPLATGLSIDKSSDLWRRYKHARNVRNDVAHLGARITKATARKVIDTVYELINFLGALPLEEATDAEDREELLGRFLQAWARLERALYQTKWSDYLPPSKSATQPSLRVSEPRSQYGFPFQNEISVLRRIRNNVVHASATARRELRPDTINQITRIAAAIEASKDRRDRSRRKPTAAA